MAKPKDKDRRAIVEQMRKEQQRAEKRRTRLIILACAAVALAIIAFPAYQLIRQEAASGQELTSIGVPAADAGCQDIVTETAQGNRDHREMGTQITYQDSPPAYGPHWPQPAAFSRKYYSASDRPELEQLVHNLEHGYNILWYDATIADDADALTAVKAVASKFEGSELTDKFIAAPWTEEDGAPFPDGAHVALTHWSLGDSKDPNQTAGVWKYCDKVSGEVVADWVEEYPYTDSPEPNAM
jgi:hypothetical protein